MRFAIKRNGGAEQQINTITTLPTGHWTHVAVTLSGGVGILYVNGVEKGRNSFMTLDPDALGSTTQNWIGRSQYPTDPYLDGRVDDLRIYNRALSPSEIDTLANDHAGPVVLASQFHFQTPPQRLSFTFDTDVTASLSADDLLVQHLGTGQTIATSFTYANETATFTFPGFAGGVFPDGHYRATLAAGKVEDVAGNPLAADVTLDFHVLAGDANRDRTVSLADFLVLRGNFGVNLPPPPSTTPLPRLFAEGGDDDDGGRNVLLLR